MSIDLETKEGRKQYLSDKLDDLLEGINESYGKVLMEELLNRLELTIKDFNDEMNTLCEMLVQKEEERQQLLEMLKTGEGLPPISPSIQTTPTEKGENSFLEFMDSEIDPTVTTTQTEKNILESVSPIEETADIPEWEKKLAKLKK